MFDFKRCKKKKKTYVAVNVFPWLHEFEHFNDHIDKNFTMTMLIDQNWQLFNMNSSWKFTLTKNREND